MLTDEAETIIAFIDELKSVLSINYDDKIKAQRADNIITFEEKNNDNF